MLRYNRSHTHTTIASFFDSESFVDDPNFHTAKINPGLYFYSLLLHQGPGLSIGVSTFPSRAPGTSAGAGIIVGFPLAVNLTTFGKVTKWPFSAPRQLRHPSHSRRLDSLELHSFRVNLL